MKRNLLTVRQTWSQTNGDSRLLRIILRLLPNKSRFSSQDDAIKEMIRAVEKIGRIYEFSFEKDVEVCPVCGWIHDAALTLIKVSQNKIIFLGGVLPDIVTAVHRAHEKGLPALSTKDAALIKVCGSYKHPCKAFDDLNHRDDYKVLFIRQRGFISLRRVRNKTRNKNWNLTRN
jgi:hypothetical protein